MKSGPLAAGFTLAELAIAMVILALLLAGAIIPISAQVELKNIAETQRSMEQARDAVIAFAIVNGRLPCPADGTLASSNAGAGKEQLMTDNTAPTDPLKNRCTAVVGVLPWSTLAVAENDSWGRRFTYRVAAVFADPTATVTWQSASTTVPAGLASPVTQSPTCVPSPAPQNATFAICSLGDMAVLGHLDDTTTSSRSSPVLGSGLPAVIVSHGKNGWGAYTSNGLRVGVGLSGANSYGVPGQNADEAANVNQSGGAVTGSYNQWLFYSRTPTTSSSACSDVTYGFAFCEFDDLVTWVSPASLISRAVTAGRLP